jgi:hypothetical protein
MLRLTSEEFLLRMRRAIRIEPTPVAIVSAVPAGPTVSLDAYRDELAARRIELVGKPGMWLDQSPTGAGKSHTDLEAFRLAEKSLSIQPTHENCQEVVKACQCAGIDAVAYPGRFSGGEKQNCWNPDADAAESLGLSVARSVCHATCEHRKDCLERGYLGQVARANEARVAVATHARAIHCSLADLMDGREFVSIHEDAMDVLMPQQTIPASMLESARFVLGRLLNDPVWLDQFGTVFTLDETLEFCVVHERPTEQRNARYEFIRHLADVVDDLLQTAADASTIAEIQVGRTLPEPPGLQAILFRICRELGIHFGDKPVWSLLLYTATGEFFRVGVLIHASRIADSTESGTRRKSDCADPSQSAATEGNGDPVGCFG